MVKVLVKIHHYQNTSVLAICDPELLGREIKDSSRCLKIRERFYAGVSTDIDEALQLLKTYNNINLIGSIVDKAVETGLVHKDAVLWLTDQSTGKKIGHVLILRV
ncbi:MAG: DUF424 family protein [Candidatus Hodarchaeota archaeon]